MKKSAVGLLIGGAVASVLMACSGGSNALPGVTPTTAPTTVPTTDPSGRPTTAPTTVPTTVPTTTPNSTLSVTPAALTLAGLGSAYAANLTAAETGNAGALTVTGCTSVASATVGTPGASTTISVTGLAAGTCTLVVADARGQRVAVSVSVMSPSPAPVGAGLFPMTIANATGINGAMTAYVWGIDPTSGNYVYLTSPTSGVTAGVPNGPVPGFALASGGQINLPYLCSGRVYVALDGKSLTLAANSGSPGGVTVPVPWQVPDADNSANVIWDFIEYTWSPASAPICQQPKFFIDSTQVDSVGIPISFQLVQSGQAPTAAIGMMPNAVTKIASAFQSLGAPWTGLTQTVMSTTTTVKRLINPSHPIDPSSTPAAGLSFDAHYLDSAIYALWTTYQSTDLVLTGSFVAPNYQTVYGRVAGLTPSGAGTTFTFTTGPNQTGSVVATFNGLPSTNDVLKAAGILAPPVPPMQPAGTAVYVGRIIAVGLNRSTFTNVASLPQPVCPPAGTPAGSAAAMSTAAGYYGGATTSGGTVLNPSVLTNWYSALVHANGYQGLAYGFADDDECNVYSTSFTAPSAGYTPGSVWQVTLNPL